MRAHLSLTFVLAAVACAEDLGPDRGDPAQYAFPAPVAFRCSGWAPAIPTTRLGLFDIEWPRSTPGEPNEGPGSEEVRRVLLAGGTIVYRYNVPALRAIVPVATVTSLQAFSIRGVTNARTYDVGVTVVFRAVVDTAAILRHGGAITLRYDRLRLVEAVIPDRAIPSLRRDANVEYVVGTNGVFCTQ